MEWVKDSYKVTTNRSEFDFSVIYGYLSNDAYWCKGVPEAVVHKAIENSLCFGVLNSEQQVGFARLVTDKATFAYLADVFIIPEYRGEGLSKWLMDCIMKHPEVQGLRRVMLVTADAQGLYSKFGFKPVNRPENFLEINVPDIYQ